MLQGLQQLAYQLFKRGLRHSPHARLLTLLILLTGWVRCGASGAGFIRRIS